MSLLDVETTAEAIQEEEELIEAVEEFVGTAAGTIKKEIETDIEDMWRTCIDWLEWLLPLWVAYRDDKPLFWELIYNTIIFAVLVLVSFFILAPSSSQNSTSISNQRRRRSMLESGTRHSFRIFQAPNYMRRHSSMSINGGLQTVQIKNNNQQQPQRPSSASSLFDTATPSRRHSSICSGRVIVEKEETDAERFEKNYDSIRMSRYNRLLLPPECKLVEKPKRAAAKKVHDNSNNNSSSSSNNKKKKKRRRKKRERESDEDQPARRLELYANNLLALVKSFLTYDYMGAGMALIRWIVAVLRIRQIRRSKSQADLQDEEDDDDDESKASISVASTTQQNLQQLPPQQRQASNASTNNHLMMAQQGSQHSLGMGPQTPDRPFDGHPLVWENSFSQSSAAMTEGSEEKKESPLVDSSNNKPQATPPPFSLDGENPARRRTSDSSMHAYSTPIQSAAEESNRVIGEPDEDKMPSLRLPLSVTTTKTNGVSSLRTSVGGKKKDLLQNYRSTSGASSLLGTTITSRSHVSTSTTSQSSSLSTTSATSLPPPTCHSTSSGEATTVHRNHYDENVNNNDRQEATIPKVDSREDESGSFEDSSDDPDNPPGRVQRFDSDFSGFFFETANTQESLKQMAIDAPLPDKNGYIVGDEFLPDSSCTPLLVFVNSRSGPQQGHLLIMQLRRLLNPIQVWDLGEDGGPETVLDSFSTAFRNLRILVCGGDGTVSWIIAALEKLNLKRKWPPIAILPLGTGNDLARIHGWGGGYNNESLIGILEDVADSYISLLDQWTLSIENKKGKVKEVKSFFNYLGVGADAQAALQVHMLRESRPQLFFSRVVNKAWYGIFGAEDIIKATSLNLPHEIQLIADGVEVKLPPDSQGIILLNIDSYSGGAPFWATGVKHDRRHNFDHASEMGNGSPTLGASRSQPRHLRRTRSLEDLGMRRSDQGQMPRIDSVEDLSQVLTDDHQRWQHVTACDKPSSCQDGILDIVSVRGAFHLGQIRVGLSSAQRLCQCREATIHIRRKVAVQIDGEPWRQNICTLRVKRKPERAIMLHKSEDKNGVETEVANLLDWAEKRRYIDGNVHYAMMKEFSRRIEHKTRQRRNNQNNNMFSLKRAIGSSGALSSYGGNYEYPS